MALQFRQWIILLVFICFLTRLNAQIIYYPTQSSDQLTLTAKDAAMLFNRAIPGSHFTVQSYTSLPQSGIVFIYDSSFINNQSCKIECSGSLIKFSAAQDAGLCFGFYHYLNELGFRFYLTGKLWEKIPTLTSPYRQENKVVSQKFKYNTWFISGGYNSWAMDAIDPNGGTSGINGHDWAQYQQRNNMMGAYRFSGHRGDIFNAEYLSMLKSNPCYVACVNGSRSANSQSVPDINNTNAMDYWASTISQRYTSSIKNILSDPVLYKNIYHDLNYASGYVGIEVPDGSAFGDSQDNAGCATGNFNGKPYPKESDQQFILANFTAEKINSVLPGKRFQCYAYFNHADVPSADISINKNIDVQVIATAFQSESSPIGVLNRWYKRYTNVSEYDYMNIPQWTGETPVFSLNNYKNTLARLKEQNSQGIVYEASPAKFASLPFLFAGGRYLQYDENIDSTINEFTASMFPPNVAVHINQLFKYWGDDNVMLGGNFMGDNKFKLPLFLQELNKAIAASQNADADVIARLQELKAYVHYIIMYYDFGDDNRSYQNKSEKAANLCLYLAKINKLQLINSYFLILDLVNKYPAAGSFYKEYNVANGTAYLNGNLPAINNEEINKNFAEDVTKYAASVTDYNFQDALEIVKKIDAAGLKPLDTIHAGLGYTNGWDYPGRSEFYFYAPAKGSININCNPVFDMPGKGFINITVEAMDKGLLVIKDETITRENNPGKFDVTVPSAGLYKVSFVTKYKSAINLTIITNGNVFFKGALYGKRAENFSADNFKSLPKYFYVPKIRQLYFSINNACYTSRCLSPDAVEGAFGIKDNNGKDVIIQTSPFDSSLYKISISDSSAGSFFTVNRMREYNLCFSNISNIEIFAEPKPICSSTDFTAEIFSKDGNCYTRLIASANSSMDREWTIIDGGKSFNYTNVRTVDLPVLLSPNALITLKNRSNCSTTQKTGDIKDYLKNLRLCTSEAALPAATSDKLTVYPNPSSSVFNFKKENTPLVLNSILVYDPQGKKVADVTNASSINLSSLPPGVYLFSAQKENDIVRGKLVKN